MQLGFLLLFGCLLLCFCFCFSKIDIFFLLQCNNKPLSYDGTEWGLCVHYLSRKGK